jgi:hypothetical protein
MVPARPEARKEAPFVEARVLTQVTETVAARRSTLEVVLFKGRRVRIRGDFEETLLRKLVSVLEAIP